MNLIIKQTALKPFALRDCLKRGFAVAVNMTHLTNKQFNHITNNGITRGLKRAEINIAQHVTLHIDAPIHPVSLHAQVVEEKNLNWASRINLYENKHFSILKNTHVACLINACYPLEMTHDQHRFTVADQWMRMLFSIDDTVDTNELRSKSLQKINDVKESIISDSYNGPLYSPKLVAIHSIYSNNKHLFSDEFKDSFVQYIRSVEYELKLREDQTPIDENILRMHRPYASGAYHAVKMGFSFQDIPYDRLEKKYFVLKPMLEDVSLHIGWINDILSWKKEFSANSYTLNVVDWHIKQGNSVGDAMSIVAKKCNDLTENFYTNKDILMKTVHTDDKENVEKAVAVIEAWLSQLYWAVNVTRYNPSSDISKTDDNLKQVMTR